MREFNQYNEHAINNYLVKHEDDLIAQFSNTIVDAFNEDNSNSYIAANEIETIPPPRYNTYSSNYSYYIAILPIPQILTNKEV